jgi:hypothetical protein
MPTRPPTPSCATTGQGHGAARGPGLHHRRRHPGDARWASCRLRERLCATQTAAPPAPGAVDRQFDCASAAISSPPTRRYTLATVAQRARRPGQQARHRQRAGHQARVVHAPADPTTTSTTCRTRSASTSIATSSVDRQAARLSGEEARPRSRSTLRHPAARNHQLLVRVVLVEMDRGHDPRFHELELAVSARGHLRRRLNGTTWSAFQNDQTLIRAIAEHDFPDASSDASIAIDQFVRWAPAIS